MLFLFLRYPDNQSVGRETYYLLLYEDPPERTVELPVLELELLPVLLPVL